MAVETIVKSVEQAETKVPYKSVIDKLLESGVKEGKELFEALNTLYERPSRWVASTKINGHKPDSS